LTRVRSSELRSKRTRSPSARCSSRARTKPSAFPSRVETEIREVLQRAKFHKYITDATRGRILDILGAAALMFEPADQVTDCRDMKDNKYLELALAASASIIVSSDEDLLVLDPWRGIRILRPVNYVGLLENRG
jgi:uncharacterized protein